MSVIEVKEGEGSEGDIDEAKGCHVEVQSKEISKPDVRTKKRSMMSAPKWYL